MKSKSRCDVRNTNPVSQAIPPTSSKEYSIFSTQYRRPASSVLEGVIILQLFFAAQIK